MDLVTELLKQGSLGFLAAVFAWLYFQERKDNKALHKDKEDLMELRRSDASETNKLLNSILPSISTALDMLSKKVQATKGSE